MRELEPLSGHLVRWSPAGSNPTLISEIEALSRHLARFWERRYRAAFAAFDAQDPPLPVKWENWREVTAREKRKQDFIRDSLIALQRARSRTRDIICLEHERRHA